MDWLEKLFGLSPDGGSGSSETVFAAGIVAILAVIGSSAYKRFRTTKQL
jgi:hypothetical protein